MQEPEKSLAEPQTQTPSNAPKLPKVGWILFTALLALLVAIIGLASQLFFWQLQKNEQASLQHQLVQTVETKLSQFTAELNNHQKMINALVARTQSEDRRNSIMTAEEAQHLLTFAQYNLIFQNNIDFASKLLQEADRKLEQINDPTITPVRKSLVGELTTLNSIPKVDIAAIIARLSAMGDQVATLSTIPIIPLEPHLKKAQTNQSWKEKLMDVFRSLKGVLTIRRLQEPIEPMPSPEHQVYIVENIRLKLTQAEWAVLHQNPALYQFSLEAAKKELQKYFARNARGASLIQMVTDLQQVNIKPDVPNLSNTMTLLQAYIRNTQQTLTESAKQNMITPAPTNSIPRALPS
ncbi:MAG: uroporphyrinogen-III C-methyltransferase [Gammaproteobacteria bacterium]|nr:uroporphyrinogen-III C-methyltransferase [Gammaproteobacteria bacterium]